MMTDRVLELLWEEAEAEARKSRVDYTVVRFWHGFLIRS